MFPEIRRQRGVGLPAAIFVVTVMVSIAAAINLLVSQNSRTFEEQTQLTRAFYAAESGAGFAMNALFPPADFPDYSAGRCAEMASTPWEYRFEVTGLAACRAEVSCAVDATVDDVEYYTLNSAGICGDIQRMVQVRTSVRLP